MKLLLNTNILIRWLQDRLAVELQSLLEMKSGETYVSTAALWEVALKPKLASAGVTPELFVDLVEQQFGADWLPIRHQHVLSLPTLPFHHRDPFDRIMLAQAQHEDMNIVTTDSIFRYISQSRSCAEV